MKGLFLKDVMTQKGHLIAAAADCIGTVAFAVLVVLSIYYGNIHSVLEKEGFMEPATVKRLIMILSFGIAAISGYLTTMVSSAFVEDYKADFGKVIMSLPKSAKEWVMARYLLYGLYVLMLIGLNLLLQPLFYMVAKIPFNGKSLAIILAGFFWYIVLALMNMPLMYRFGTKISAIVNIMLNILLFVFLMTGITYITEKNIQVSELDCLFGTVRDCLAILFPVLVIFGVPLSLLCSLRVIKGGKNQLC